MAQSAPSPLCVDAMHSAVPDDDSLEFRSMFGCPCYFAGGNLYCGVHRDRLFLRLGEDRRGDLLALAGSVPFQPQGRIMREYVCVPLEMLDNHELLAGWLEISMRYALAQPSRPRRNIVATTAPGTASPNKQRQATANASKRKRIADVEATRRGRHPTR